LVFFEGKVYFSLFYCLISKSPEVGLIAKNGLLAPNLCELTESRSITGEIELELLSPNARSIGSVSHKWIFLV